MSKKRKTKNKESNLNEDHSVLYHKDSPFRKGRVVSNKKKDKLKKERRERKWENWN